MGRFTVAEEVMECDVLCVGGGIAGLMAAIRAGERGAKVIVAEKANTLRSGAGATGNDHFRCYIPEFHGPDFEGIVDEQMQSQGGGMRPRSFVRTWMAKSTEVVSMWDNWGIPMKHDGQWEFAGHAFPGRPFPTLKYAGQKQKPILTREASKRGANIVNRVMVFDLLRDDKGIIGAMGVDVREEKVVIFKANSVVLGTGNCVRLYPSTTPGWDFNRSNSPATTGDGRAMAYRAGAELMNLEFYRRWAGARYFNRCGKATWIGVIRDAEGKPVGPFVTQPDRRYGDPISDAYHSLFEDYAKAGNGPVYMDGRGMSEDDLEYMRWGLMNEGNMALLNHLEEEGIDLRKNPVEFMTYEMTTFGGVYFNDKAETSVKGLYAAGDEYFGGISGASCFGWIAGDNAAEYVKETRSPDIEDARAEIEEKKNLLCRLRSRDDGPDWKESNTALEQVMFDYAGPVKSGNELEAGLKHLQRLRAKVYHHMIARNQHELMHSLEVLNLFDLGELVFLTALERKESRGNYVRSDYPFTNPILNKKVLLCRKEGEAPVLYWRETKGH